MNSHKKYFPVEKICKIFKVSPSAYYNWKQNTVSNREFKDEQLLQNISKVYDFSHKTYGSPRIYNELKQKDICENE